MLLRCFWVFELWFVSFRWLICNNLRIQIVWMRFDTNWWRCTTKLVAYFAIFFYFYFFTNCIIRCMDRQIVIGNTNWTESRPCNLNHFESFWWFLDSKQPNAVLNDWSNFKHDDRFQVKDIHWLCVVYLYDSTIGNNVVFIRLTNSCVHSGTQLSVYRTYVYKTSFSNIWIAKCTLAELHMSHRHHWLVVHWIRILYTIFFLESISIMKLWILLILCNTISSSLWKS